MVGSDRTKVHSGRFGGWRAVPVLIAGSLVLTGCSSVPDAVNPAEWYKSTVELFSGDETPDGAAREQLDREQQVAEAAGQEQTQQEYPRVSDVEKQRQARNLGLAADPDRPRYAPAIQRQGEAAAPPPATAPAAPTAPTPATPPMRTAAAEPARSQPQAPVLTAPRPSLTNPGGAQEPAATVPGVPQVNVPTRAEQEAEFTELQNRMQKRLAEILSAAQKEPEFVRPLGLPAGVGVGDTVVIGGTGVEGQEGPTLGAAAVPGTPAGADREAWPLPPGAAHVATIVFPNGSARLSSRDRRILAQIVQLQRERGGTLRVVGHSSSRTKNLSPTRHQAVNYRVSALRARTVAKELVRQGANRDAILTAALSDSLPIYRENMPNGEAGNRRAEIYLTN